MNAFGVSEGGGVMDRSCLGWEMKLNLIMEHFNHQACHRIMLNHETCETKPLWAQRIPSYHKPDGPQEGNSCLED